MSAAPTVGRRTQRVLFVATVAAYAALLCWGLNEVWLYGHHGWTGARRGVEARNYLKWGYTTAAFGMVEDLGSVAPERPTVYWNHPPLGALAISVSYALFGVAE